MGNNEEISLLKKKRMAASSHLNRLDHCRDYERVSDIILELVKIDVKLEELTSESYYPTFRNTSNVQS